MKTHDLDTFTDSSESNNERRRLQTLASELGYESEEAPRSVLELIAATGNESADKYIPILRRAHEIGVISHGVSSNTIDSLRYVIEMSGQGDTAFYDWAKADEGDASSDKVVEQWSDIEALLGISQQTSAATLQLEASKPLGDREVPYPDRIHSGSVPFESQAGGGVWGAGEDW